MISKEVTHILEKVVPGISEKMSKMDDKDRELLEKSFVNEIIAKTIAKTKETLWLDKRGEENKREDALNECELAIMDEKLSRLTRIYYLFNNKRVTEDAGLINKEEGCDIFREVAREVVRDFLKKRLDDDSNTYVYNTKL